MKKILGLVMVLGLLAAPLAFAENNGAGCGLGKKLFEGQKGLIPNILAATTNGTSGNNTFGMTSGTSGCNADSVVKEQYEQEMFVAQNIDSLSQDMAMGGGQYLHAMANLMGCGDGQFSDFASLTQAKYEVLLPSAGTAPALFLTGLKQEMAAHPSLAASCTRIS